MSAERKRHSHEPRPAGEAGMAALRLIRNRAAEQAERTGDPQDAPPEYVDRILELWENGNREEARAMMTEWVTSKSEKDETSEPTPSAEGLRLF